MHLFITLELLRTVRRGSAARLDEKYTLKDQFQNRVYVFKASGVRSDEKIYIERLIRKSCL